MLLLQQTERKQEKDWINGTYIKHIKKSKVYRMEVMQGINTEQKDKCQKVKSTQKNAAVENMCTRNANKTFWDDEYKIY